MRIYLLIDKFNNVRYFLNKEIGMHFVNEGFNFLVEFNTEDDPKDTLRAFLGKQNKKEDPLSKLSNIIKDKVKKKE